MSAGATAGCRSGAAASAESVRQRLAERRGLERGVGGEEAGEVEAARVAVETRRRVAVEGAAASCKARRRVTGEVWAARRRCGRRAESRRGGERRGVAARRGAAAWEKGARRQGLRRVAVRGTRAVVARTDFGLGPSVDYKNLWWYDHSFLDRASAAADGPPTYLLTIGVKISVNKPTVDLHRSRDGGHFVFKLRK